MAEETILTWTPANWVTVLLMVTLGGAILVMVVKIIQTKRAPVAAPAAS
jgi:hypothetical protein